MKTTKEKVLIITTFSEPHTITAVQRTKGYMNYLHQYGYHPVLVSKNWNKEVLQHVIVEEDSYGTKYLLKLSGAGSYVNEKFAVKGALIRQFCNLMNRFLMLAGISFLFEYNDLYKQSKKILEQNKDIKKAIVILAPFPLLFIGYKLKKKYRIKWVADYRDSWTTAELQYDYNYEEGWLRRKLDYLSEKKWAGKADLITSVSDYYTQKLSTFVRVPGKTIYNGFFKEDMSPGSAGQQTKKDKFVIIHNGTIYPTQKIEMFTDGFKQFIDKNPHANIEVKFIGASVFKETNNRIVAAMKGYEGYFESTDRIPRDDLHLTVREQASVLLMLSHGKELKGVTSSKIFEYMQYPTAVLCCPTDEDVVEDLLRQSGQGFFCKTSNDVYNHLENMYTEFMENNYIKFNYNKDAVLFYSRENQTKEMAAMLDQL